MNGNVEGVRTCVNSGLSVNDKDDESWAPLHYACWYVSICIVVKVLCDRILNECLNISTLYYMC